MTQRVNLTIPDDLAEQIEKYRSQVNQSAIFTEAMRKEIQKLSQPTAAGNFTTLIGRLKDQREDIRYRSYEKGALAGRTYAEDHADYPQLERIGELAWSSDWPRMTGFDRIPHEARDYARNMAQGTESDVENRLSYERFYEGFAHGMLAVWNAVKNEI